MYFVPAEGLETSANSRAQHYRQGGDAPMASEPPDLRSQIQDLRYIHQRLRSGTQISDLSPRYMAYTRSDF